MSTVSAKSFKCQTNLMTMSSMKRKRNAITIEKKLEVIDQLAKGVRDFSLAVHYNICIATVTDIKKQ